ncbi:MAG: biotin--[acetyl-CoA-carboxylase] ligase [Epsilonproteobacteria bacterium]|nr:biotin--[acetyl-CoA-carboxylase] ligase [Campylobacterota bacterium]
MVVNWFRSIESTHLYLIDEIKKGNIKEPTLIGADFQTNGIGSRGNLWQSQIGNLFFSFCVEEKHLPKDLQLASISIYFAYLMKEVLSSFDSKTWLKWPNDFYLENRKIGGVITTKIGDKIIGSMGLNIVESPREFGILDVYVEPKKLTERFLENLEKKLSWKQVFSKYKIDFQNSKDYFCHLGGELKSLSQAKLCEDGSIELDKRRVYSLR